MTFDEEASRRYFREKIAPGIKEAQRARERAKSEGLAHYTTHGPSTGTPKPEPARGTREHAMGVLHHVEEIWSKHSNPADATRAAAAGLHPDDVKAAHEHLTGPNASDDDARRAAKLRNVMRAHENGVGQGGTATSKAAEIHARPGVAKAGMAVAPAGVGKVQAPDKPEQVGPRGGRYVITKGGQRLYLGSEGGKPIVRKA